ncbi:MAG: hypothetical protein SF066_02550 [Thermoanaerobaculia bacterium]|nr:hypothetical protein [Thermoanaerobaculia bacterium]
MPSEVRTYSLPNGHQVRYISAPEVCEGAYYLEVRDGDQLLIRTCSCGGVTKECPEGMTASCKCYKNPPQLSCVPPEDGEARCEC